MATPRRVGANYWKLFTSAAVSNLGDGLMTVAVVWLASSLTREASLIALVGLMSRLPWLLFALPAGAITDRYDRRALVAWMDMARFGVVVAFAVVDVPGVAWSRRGWFTRRTAVAAAAFILDRIEHAQSAGR